MNLREGIMKRALLVAMFAVLATVLLLQGLGQRAGAPGKGAHLAAYFSPPPDGWSMLPVELGPTEAGSGAVRQVLRFDDVLNCEYTSAAGARFALYVAYWGPGKMPVQLVASHTPDRCWTENGWKCEAIRHAGAPGATGGLATEGEWRVFAPPVGPRVQVAFWHFVGGRSYDYGERFNAIPSIWRWWREAWHQMFRAPPEQYFIRISSETPFEVLEREPGFREIVRRALSLGGPQAGGR